VPAKATAPELLDALLDCVAALAPEMSVDATPELVLAAWVLAAEPADVLGAFTLST
jgi:hypothetical protein